MSHEGFSTLWEALRSLFYNRKALAAHIPHSALQPPVPLGPTQIIMSPPLHPTQFHLFIVLQAESGLCWELEQAPAAQDFFVLLANDACIMFGYAHNSRRYPPPPPSLPAPSPVSVSMSTTIPM